MEYLKYTDPNAFLDYPEQSIDERYRANYVKCPKCSGHGGWNLQINAYKLPDGYKNTSENRHKFCHFRALCSNCNGWGYVIKGSLDETCIHEFEEKCDKTLCRCEHLYICKKCGKKMVVDSSD